MEICNTSKSFSLDVSKHCVSLPSLGQNKSHWPKQDQSQESEKLELFLHGSKK